MALPIYKTLFELRKGMDKYPQTLVNVRTRDRVNLSQMESVQLLKAQVERELEGQGRVLLRTSGTEPLVRVMVEGADGVKVQALADRLAEAVRDALDGGD